MDRDGEMEVVCPSTVTCVPLPGSTAMPPVPSGVSSVIEMMSVVPLVIDADAEVTFQLAPNQPRGVVNPPSAALRPARCGSKVQFEP